MHAAHLIFELHPGQWEISQIMENVASLKFWHKVVDEFTNGNFSLKYLENGGLKKQILVFNNLQ